MSAVLTKNLAESFKNHSLGIYFDEFYNPTFSLNIHKVEKQSDIDTILDIPQNI